MKPHSKKKYQTFHVETGIQKVLEVLYKYPDKEFSLSDLAKEAGVAKAHIGDMLSRLEGLDFVKIEKLSKIWRIKANRDNWQFQRSKIVYNLDFIYGSNLVEFLNQKYNNPKAIVLFGSFRAGTDTSDSDIDIAIESDEFEGYDTVGLKDLEDFEKTINRKIQIHRFNRRKIPLDTFNSIANGIILLGFLEVHL